MKNIFLLIVVSIVILLLLAGLGLWQLNRITTTVTGENETVPLAEEQDLAQGDKVELSSPGNARKTDLKKIRRMIKEDKLSDHEAEFYQKLP